MSVSKTWLAAVSAVLLLFVLFPVKFNADVFDLLPEGTATVAGLQRYQQSFGSSEAVILAIENPDSEVLHRVVSMLADHLMQQGLARSAIWQNPLNENQDALSQLLAFFWLNATPEQVSQLSERLSPPGVDQKLQDTLERMGTSFNAGEIATLANDPLGLSSITGNLAGSHNNPFASEDGKLRVLYLSYAGEASHYFAYAKWLKDIDAAITTLRTNGDIPDSVIIGKTGNPVFVVEFGSQLMRDLSLAALGTLLVVMLLFWWAHRSWRALIWLSAGLLLTLATTIIIGSRVFGALNAVSFGFAALLMGLAVDYGLIVYQAVRTAPDGSAKTLRQHLQPSILWAAVTTSGAFFVLTLSSLPGLTQLGLLVAIGILVAAIMVLYLFLPAIANRSTPSKQETFCWIVPGKAVLGMSLTATLIAATIVVLVPPSIVTDVAKLQFNNNRAQKVHDSIQARLNKNTAQTWLIFEGETPQNISMALRDVEQLLQHTSPEMKAVLPTVLWPDTAHQANNLSVLATLANGGPRIYSQVENFGFKLESLSLTQAIFEHWRTFAASQSATNTTTLWPDHPANQWLYEQFSSRDNGVWYALGEIDTTSLTAMELQRLHKKVSEIPGASLVGWSLLADDLANTMVKDVVKVLVPMLVALVLLLGAAFKHWADVLLSFVSLGFGLMLLVAAMSVLGWQWNIINLTALPLLLGAGVDYSIHIQLALKRCSGNLREVFQSVGRAILLCGASTAVAFGSLGLGTNAGIASLGKVTALGIVILALSSVLLLPQWWLMLRPQTQGKQHDSL